MKRTASLLAATSLLAAAPSALANGRFPSAEQLVVEPGNPSHIAVQVTYGFIQTRDAGATWHWTCEDAAGYGGVLDPPIALLDTGVLIAGVFDGLVVSSADGCDLGFVPGLEGKFFVDVSASKVDPRRAIAVSSNGLGGNQFDTRLWASTDTAATWSPAGVPLPSDFLALTADAAPSNEQRVYLSGFVIPSSTNYIGSLARSSDGGASWEIVDIPGSTNTSGPYLAAIDPNDPDTIYVRLEGDIGVLLVSHDAGDTWETVFTATSQLLGFALSPDGTEVRVGTETDGIHGASASDLVFSQVSSLGVRCLTWSGDVLYACAKEAVAGFTIGKSLDKGVTFQPIHNLPCLSGPDPACAAGTTIADECPGPWAAQKQVLQTDLCETGTTAATTGAGGGTTDDGAGDDGCACSVPSPSHDTTVPIGSLLAVVGVAGAIRRRRSRRYRTCSQNDA
jgi:MYXO-CTERM domain-containing protein